MRGWWLAVSLLLAGCGDSVTGPDPLADQEALSKIAKDRHYTIAVYHEGMAEIDGQRVHVLAERAVSKFGGSSTRLYTLPAPALELATDVGSYTDSKALRRAFRLHYDHDAGAFELHTTRGEYTLPDVLVETVTADFEEEFTLAEERCRKAVDRVAENPASIANTDYAASICLWSGDIERARPAATRLLTLRGDMAGYTAGYARHKGHTHLGRIALRDGDTAAAVEHLASSARVKPSATMTSFGPNMSLAQDLLEAGETGAVLAYLEACGAFWNRAQVTAWSEQIRRGERPDFGANLNY